MVVLALFGLIPVLVGLVSEYLVCRIPRRKLWRWVPPILCLLVAGTVFFVRYFGWSMGHTGEKAPLETLLFMPCLPATLVLGGMLGGWKLWKWRWMPRVVRVKKSGSRKG